METSGPGFLAMLGGGPLRNALLLSGSFDVYGDANDSHLQSQSPAPVLHRLWYGEYYGQRGALPAGLGNYGGYERGGAIL